MAIKNATITLQISLERTWGSIGNWDNHPQVVWGPMVDVSGSVANNTTQVNGTTSLAVTGTLVSSPDNIVRGTKTFAVTASISTGSKTRLRGSPISMSSPTSTVTVGRNILGPQATFNTQATMSVFASNTVRGTKTLSATTNIPNAGGGRIHASPNVAMTTPNILLSAGVLRLVMQNVKRTFVVPPEITTYTIQPLTRVNTIDAEIRSFKLPKLTRNIKVKEEIREYATNYRF